MKTSIITLLFALSATFTFSQNTEHLTFKNIPIDGTLMDFVSKMKQSGFTHLSSENGTAIFNGDFAGYKNCQIGVLTLKQMDLVYKIGVLFPEQETWSGLSGNYFDLKQMLTEKYGIASEEVEKFESYIEPRDDNMRMSFVKMDKCKYYAIWETDKGKIQLSIERVETSDCIVKLTYLDKINGDKIKAQAIDDL